MSGPTLSVRARLSAAAQCVVAPLIALRKRKGTLRRPFPYGCEPLEPRLMLSFEFTPWYSILGGAGTDPYYCNCDCGCNSNEVAGNNKTSGDGGRGANSGPGNHPNEFPDIAIAHPPPPRLPRRPVPPRAASGGETVLEGSSGNPIRYFDGLPQVDTTDLISNGFGKPYGVTRSFALYLKTGPMGNHWNVDQMTYILHNPGGDYARPNGATDTFAVIESGSDTRYFDSFDNNTPHTCLTSRNLWMKVA